MPYDDRGRDWSTAAANLGTPRIGGHPEAKKRQGPDSTQTLRGSMDLLTPEFQTFILQNCETKFCCFEPPSLLQP